MTPDPTARAGRRIHITIDLEDRIRAEIQDMKSLPLYGAPSEEEYQRAIGRLDALQMVLHWAHSELDE